MVLLQHIPMLSPSGSLWLTKNTRSDFEHVLHDPKGGGHDCMDAGGRVTQGAVTEEARNNFHSLHEISGLSAFLIPTPVQYRQWIYCACETH